MAVLLDDGAKQMSRVLKAAKLIMSHGKPVDIEWIAEKMGVDREIGNSIYLSLRRYKCYQEKVTKEDGRVKIQVLSINIPPKNVDLIGSRMDEILGYIDEGLSLNQISELTNISYSSLHKFAAKRGIKAKKVRVKKIKKTVIEQCKTDPQNRLWHIALGRKVNG